MKHLLRIVAALAVMFLSSSVVTAATKNFNKDILRVRKSNSDVIQLISENQHATGNAELLVLTPDNTGYLTQWSDDDTDTVHTGRLVLGVDTNNGNGILVETSGEHDIEFTTYADDSTVPDMLLHSSGDLTLGTTTKYSEDGVTAKLTVNGFVAVDSFRVKKNIVAGTLVIQPEGWADDVFDPEYKLLSLEDLRKSIMQNGKLPGVPSEKEVMAEGVSVGEMQATLLRKIEELTLYVMAQDEKLKAQEKEILHLKQRQ